MSHATLRCLTPVLAVLFAFCGCAHVAAPVALELPKIEPEPAVAAETTVLERYQEVSKLYNAEKAQTTALAALLDENTRGRKKAETEVQSLREQVATLDAKSKEMDALKQKYEEVQKTCLDLEGTLRSLRRDLLQEKLSSAKQEQQILAMRIEKVRERRKQALDRPDEPAPGASAIPGEGKLNAATP